MRHAERTAEAVAAADAMLLVERQLWGIRIEVEETISMSLASEPIA